MRAILFVLVVAVCLFAKALIAHGQEPEPAPVHNDMGLAPADPPPQAFADLLAEVKALRAAKAAGDKHGSAMAIAALVAALGKFLIDWLKSLKADELSDKAKAALPWLLSILGAAVAIAWRYGKGDDWTTSIIVGGGVPGMVLVHELLDGLKGLLRKKPAPAVAPAAPAPPAAPAALVIVLAGLALGAASCGPNARGNAINFGENFANCGIGKIPSTAANVQPVVSDALQHDPAWQQALAGLGAEVGVDVVTCAVAAAIATWQQAAAQHASIAPEVQNGIARGKTWLAGHGVAPQAAP